MKLKLEVPKRNLKYLQKAEETVHTFLIESSGNSLPLFEINASVLMLIPAVRFQRCTSWLTSEISGG